MANTLDLSLLLDNKMYFNTICGGIEYVKYKTIYLGIESNILAIDDRIYDEDIYPNLSVNSEKFLMQCFAPPHFKDFTATLYLGKIEFNKNKQGILVPKFIPSNITDSSFEGLNVFWLNEINKKVMPTNKHIQPRDTGLVGYIDGMATYPTKNERKDLKIHYFRHKDNIVLSKEQIISYFTQLHQKNTEFIQNYIASINKNLGIKAYHLNDRLFENLAQKGILPKSMIKRYTDTHKLIRNNALDLTILDYLSTLKETNHKMLFKIVFYDELFYWYFALSLKNFIVNFSASFCDENKLLFNPGAYQQYVHLATQMRQSGEIDPKTGDFKKEFKLRFENQMFETDEYYRELFFSNNGGLMSVDDEYTKLQFISPNQALFERRQPITPSPLGKYYFELSDNKDVYIEFFNRSYPSITNAPKGWSKEMMRKLELGLE
ncbi:hypothetical protein [Campylobacter troglodytis]|uniref:hypothetical protein n=1 Tax=Campylobacter troglodytis TaxID=654363 RepID=UPI00115BBA9D|nr:hypothetical protein [Campylobacter troglodytis]TQR60446.1 hypothetical protein DMC01_05555 [Campylobacter troglodytis]